MPENKLRIKIEVNPLQTGFKDLKFQLGTLNHIEGQIILAGAQIESAIKERKTVAVTFPSNMDPKTRASQIKDLAADVSARLGLYEIRQSGGEIVVVFDAEKFKSFFLNYYSSFSSPNS